MDKVKKFPIHPKHPERICWGCDKYCSVNDLGCGNGAERTQHPSELFGDDWLEWENGLDSSRFSEEIEESKSQKISSDYKAK